MSSVKPTETAERNKNKFKVPEDLGAMAVAAAKCRDLVSRKVFGEVGREGIRCEGGVPRPRGALTANQETLDWWLGE